MGEYSPWEGVPGKVPPRNQQKLQEPFLTALQSLLVGDGWFLHVGLYADIAI